MTNKEKHILLIFIFCLSFSSCTGHIVTKQPTTPIWNWCKCYEEESLHLEKVALLIYTDMDGNSNPGMTIYNIALEKDGIKRKIISDSYTQLLIWDTQWPQCEYIELMPGNYRIFAKLKYESKNYRSYGEEMSFRFNARAGMIYTLKAKTETYPPKTSVDLSKMTGTWSFEVKEQYPSKHYLSKLMGRRQADRIKNCYDAER